MEIDKKRQKKYGYLSLGSVQLRYNKKSLFKTLTWRAISIILSFSLSYIFLGDVKTATTFTIIYAVIATTLYYGHERFWALVRKKGWVNI